jgi:hypothetical protein
MSVSHVDFFVEEPSLEAALRILVPRLRPGLSFDIYVFEGVTDMLSKLPARLGAVARYIQPDWCVVVLRDEDRKPCKQLKKEIEITARRAGLVPKGRSGPFNVLTRIVIEELEAWFLGDVPALVQAYPGVPGTLANRRPFRDPDGVKGGTWEALERVLQSAGYFRGGLRKVELARAVAARMDPMRNTSRSFQHFRDGILGL